MDLIDRQTIIAEFEWCKEQSIDKDKWQEAIDRINALPAADTDMNAYSDKLWHIAYERGKSEAVRWIPCSERLPREYYHPRRKINLSSDMLVTCIDRESYNYRYIDMAITQNGEWQFVHDHYGDCDVPSGHEIVAWLPLPEPYKDGD